MRHSVRKSKGEKGQSTGENGDKNGFVSRLFGFIGKKAGMNQEEIDSAVEEVLKGNSVSFNERFNEIKNRKIADEIWDICYALQASLCSILNDEELDSTGAATAMNESLDEFTAVVKEAISNWSGGKVINIVKSDEVTESDLAMISSSVSRCRRTQTVSSTSQQSSTRRLSQRIERSYGTTRRYIWKYRSSLAKMFR